MRNWHVTIDPQALEAKKSSLVMDAETRAKAVNSLGRMAKADSSVVVSESNIQTWYAIHALRCGGDSIITAKMLKTTTTTAVHSTSIGRKYWAQFKNVLPQLPEAAKQYLLDPRSFTDLA